MRTLLLILDDESDRGLKRAARDGGVGAGERAQRELAEWLLRAKIAEYLAHTEKVRLARECFERKAAGR